MANRKRLDADTALAAEANGKSVRSVADVAAEIDSVKNECAEACSEAALVFGKTAGRCYRAGNSGTDEETRLG
jgi:hypothetical protein